MSMATELVNGKKHNASNIELFWHGNDADIISM